MKIEAREILVKDVFEGYEDREENGVVAFNGKLDVRPAYQREFVYKDKQRDEVINTVRHGFPLNVMYWVKTGEDTYEVLDGQQRTISICQYLNGDFSIDYQYFFNLTDSEQEDILNYKLMVYICEGTDKEKLDWFKIVNIAGEKLLDQELRNAVYTGKWLTDAKRFFSRTSCPAYGLASDYVTGSPIRQEYLEKALKWISDKQGIELEEYMAKHQADDNASELWLYFKEVIGWIEVTFTNKRKEMKGVDWGSLFNKYGKNLVNSDDMEKRVAALMADDDVTNKKGIYDYVLSGNESKLSIRAFTQGDKRSAYEKQKGICPVCGEHFELNEMQADHITPWSKGGKTIPENCQMLCADCNRRKSNI